MKILIVDDNPDDLTLLQHIVEKNGHVPLKARNGQEGLEQAAHYRPDLIISDALMPVMDGFLFLKTIKEDETLLSIPFIFYSASYQEDRDVELAESLGACGYIFKPLDPNELWKEIERILERCRQEQPAEPTAVKQHEVEYLQRYSEIIATKLEQKVAELEKALHLRSEAELALQKKSEFLQRSLDALTHPFYVINVNDYTIAMANTAAHFQQEARQGGTCFQLTHNRDEPCNGTEHPCTLQEILKKRSPVVLEHVHQDKHGAEQYIEIHAYPVFSKDGGITQIIEYCIDITERKLRDDERRQLTTVLEHVTDSIIITDNNAIIQYVNPAFEKITGYSKEMAIGKNPNILQSGKHSAEFYREMWDTLTKGRPWRGFLTNKKKDGSLYEEEVSITPVMDETGKITKYVALKRDVTEQKKLEIQLQQAQKMEALGTLAGGIAHDFNNILSAILGYSDLVIEKLPEGSMLRMHQEQVITAGIRARELVKQILTFSRQTGQERHPIQIYLVVKEVIKLLRSSIPTTIEIKANINPEAGLVLADPTQLHQIIMNLGTNAYHAMRKTGGILTINLDVNQIENDNYLVRTSQLLPGSYVRLEVRDTGCGMDKQTLGKIFEPYFTTKDKGEGTGLGLAIVHGIVKSYDGYISVETQMGKGTIFCVYLPRIEPEQAVAAADEKKEYPHGTEKIMLVDDEESIVEMLQCMLKSLGYKTCAFTDSRTLLQTFQNAPGDFDLIITDMTMPHMTGAEMSKRILAIRPDIPIILCSGYSDLIDKAIATTIGIREYLSKPIAKNELAITVRKVLDKNKTPNQSESVP